MPPLRLLLLRQTEKHRAHVPVFFMFHLLGFRLKQNNLFEHRRHARRNSPVHMILTKIPVPVVDGLCHIGQKNAQRIDGLPLCINQAQLQTRVMVGNHDIYAVL